MEKTPGPEESGQPMKKTIGDYIAKDNKALSFEERADKWQKQVKPICEELGILPWAQLHFSEESVSAIPSLKNIWMDGKE